MDDPGSRVFTSGRTGIDEKRPTLDDGLSIDLHPGAELFFQSVSTR
jgi:TRAP-type uncharacterized transport system substrate-binding protein